MSIATTNSLYVTYVEKHGAFLRIWGQIDKNLAVVIENSLLELTPQFDQGHYVPAINNIPVGLFCCAKYKDAKYYRARVSNILMLPQNLVEVHFIDYGNKEILPVTNIRTTSQLGPALTNLPPQAHDFILANVTHIGLAWDNNTISLISNEIRYIELQFIIIQQVNSYTLIKLFRNGEDFALTLFNRGLVLSMASVSQTMILQSSNVPTPVATFQQPVVTQTPTLLSYKAVTIEPGTESYIYVSYVSDGPCQFSVQLQKLEESLARLMRELNRMPLHPLEEDPLPGTVCVAKCIEDDHICRAVVTSMVDGQYKVFYVDFGNTEVVPITNLYQIPFKYVILKVMAMRYALAGLERSSVTLEMKCAFKEFVSDKLLRMRSLPPPTRSGLPLCDLYDSNNVNVLDILKKAAMLAYPEVIQLTRGFSQEVLVSYVYSCSHFYVQLKAKEEDLRKIMEDLQIQCPQAEVLEPSKIKPGLPCCALFDADAQWYRAQIIAQENSIVKVRYVDYGNEELVDVSNLRMPVGNLLTALRPQALECCLNGYQNMEDDVERDNILEELILEKEFTMRVIEMQNSRALVDLIDSARYNVGSLLLERLASAMSQVSPPLIQESHHIEPRKRQSQNGPQENYTKFDRTNSRDTEKSWGRRDSSERAFSPKESNDRGFHSKENNRNFTRKDSNERFNQSGRDRGFSRDSDRTPTNDAWTSPNSKERNWNHNKQEIASNNERNNNRKPLSWRRDRSPRDDSKNNQWNNEDDKPAYRGKRDGFRRGGDDNADQGSDNTWNKPKRRGGDDNADQGSDNTWNKPKRDGFKKDTWGNESSSWKQKSPNAKESSEKSWSEGSEKGWRQNKRNDDRPRRDDFKGGRGNNRDHFSKPKSNFEERVTFKKVENPAEDTDTFNYLDLQGKTEDIVITWFRNPSNFFCQLKKDQGEFRDLMEDIQNFYCNVKPESVPVNAPVVALFPEDNVLYRAYVNEVNGNQYHVQYIDFGNLATTTKVYRVEKKFMNLPAQAVCCALDGIAPLDDGNDWTNIDSFATYFDKEVFSCTFNSGENNGYLVNLSYDNQNLSEVLISAGLAKGISSEYFDPSILLGQQLRVTLGEIQSLNEFYVNLESGLQLLCTLHNLASASETFEDTLKQYVNATVIVYVDNVLDQALEITIYDTTGVKVKVIEPDEGAFETVDCLCALPVLSNTITGWVSFLTPSEGEKHKIFIQPTEHASIIEGLLDRLFNEYNDSTLENPLEVEIGTHYAVHSSDTNWYRGLAENVEGENVTVSFIDYGNSETVAITELRELSQEFKEIHALALEVLASDIDDSYNEQEVSANVWYGESCWEGAIVKINELQPPGVPPENESVVNLGNTEEQPVTTQPEEVLQQETLEHAENENQIGYAVCLSHVDSPSQFYVQLQEAIDEINHLQSTLQEEVDTYPDLENPAAGVLCAAPYSVDQQWYRAQVLDADSDITTVRFVDYGNTDVITNATTRVKTLSSDMLALEQHARRCSLLIKPNDDVEWSTAAIERFEALTSCDNLSVEILHQDEKTTFVNLYANGENVADVLLKENLAISLELEMESSCTGYISNLNSPSEFWVQLENSVADLEWIADQLVSASNFTELEDLTPGSLCAALYPDDEMWYRARILSNTVAGLEVLFIDYGNSCTCTGLRQLPEDLIMLPALAQKCSLQKPSGVLQWSAKATEQFKEISADGATIFNIDKLSTGETLIVRLLLDSEDISLQLMPATEKGYLSYIETVFSFWVQKCEDEPKLEEVSQDLSEAAEWPNCEEVVVGSIVAALQTDDEMWYRAKVLSVNESDYEVLFIDYGNVGLTKEIRSYTKNDVPPLANQYKLEPLPGFRWMEKEATDKLMEISNDGATIFDIEFGNENNVRLYLDGVDIRTEMDTLSISSVQSTPRRGKSNIQTSISTTKDLEPDEFLDLVVDPDNPDLNILNLELEKPQEETEQIAEYARTENAVISPQVGDETPKIENENEKTPEKEYCENENDIIEKNVYIEKMPEKETSKGVNDKSSLENESEKLQENKGEFEESQEEVSAIEKQESEIEIEKQHETKSANEEPHGIENPIEEQQENEIEIPKPHENESANEKPQGLEKVIEEQRENEIEIEKPQEHQSANEKPQGIESAIEEPEIEIKTEKLQENVSIIEKPKENEIDIEIPEENEVKRTPEKKSEFTPEKQRLDENALESDGTLENSPKNQSSVEKISGSQSSGKNTPELECKVENVQRETEKTPEKICATGIIGAGTPPSTNPSDVEKDGDVSDTKDVKTE
ncbi:hypothetical protein FQR65_LT03737 [Abscondita terminalis]|nr:hypothetical protein FQR65_LT03737 [Abscondita terminalis]